MCLAKRMFPNPAKPVLGTPFTRPYGLLLLMLAALVAYGARSLTCGLAGCLALTASTFFTVFCKLFVFKVLMCFMAHSSFMVVDARLFYSLRPLALPIIA